MSARAKEMVKEYREFAVKGMKLQFVPSLSGPSVQKTGETDTGEPTFDTFNSLT